MKLLNRYILRESIIFFLINLFTFTGILLTIRMLQFAALIINKGVAPKYIINIFISIIPTFLEIAIPMAALLGVMLAFARMSGDSEIIVMRGVGVSLIEMIKPIIFLAAAFFLISLYISRNLSPWGNNSLEQNLFEIAQNKSTSGLNEGVFNKLGKITLYSEEIDDKDGNLKKVLIDDKRDEKSRKIIFAQSGRILSNPEDRSIILKLENGYIHEIINGNYSLTNFSNNNLLINFNEINQSEEDNPSQDKRVREMYPEEIKEQILKYTAFKQEVESTENDFSKLRPETFNALDKVSINSLSQINRKIRRLKTEEGRRWSMPFSTFLLTILGLPLGIVPPRTQKSWGVGLSVTIGLIVFTLYYVLLSLGIALGEGGKIPVVLGLWLPNIIAGIICVIIIYKVTTEKWNSIANGVEIALDKILKKFGITA